MNNNKLPRRTPTPACEVMRPIVYHCFGSTPVASAAEIMSRTGVGFLPVFLDGSKDVIGVVTDRDLAVRVLAEHRAASIPVRDVMTGDVLTCRPEEDLVQLELRMSHYQVGRLVVVDDEERAIGVVSLSDIACVEDAELVGGLFRSVVEREAHNPGEPA